MMKALCARDLNRVGPLPPFFPRGFVLPRTGWKSKTGSFQEDPVLLGKREGYVVCFFAYGLRL